MSMDYAVAPAGELGVTHLLSLSYALGAPRTAAARVEPPPPQAQPPGHPPLWPWPALPEPEPPAPVKPSLPAKPKPEAPAQAEPTWPARAAPRPPSTYEPRRDPEAAPVDEWEQPLQPQPSAP